MTRAKREKKRKEEEEERDFYESECARLATFLAAAMLGGAPRRLAGARRRGARAHALFTF